MALGTQVEESLKEPYKIIEGKYKQIQTFHKIKKIQDFPIILIEKFKILSDDKKNILSSLKQQKINFNRNRFKDSYNYAIEYDKFYENLYSDSLECCKSILEPFTIAEDNISQAWCFYSTEDDYVEVWHNHLRTSTINLVYYVNTSNNGGALKFSYNNKVMEYFPKEYDMLIFPNFLNHCPMRPIGDNPRISINLEIKCKENSHHIFKEFLN
jgi:hypothetical protein